MRVLIPAGKVPDGTEVTKRNGEKVYIKMEAIEIYRSNAIREKVFPLPGTVFLLSRSGCTEVTKDTQLLANLTDARSCETCCFYNQGDKP